MHRRLLLCAPALLCAAPLQVRAQSAAATPALPPELRADLPEARWRGAAELRFLGLKVYEARLWSPAPLAGDGAQQPLALELIYARGLSGARIAQRSIDEMRRIGPFTDAQATRWGAALTALLPEVASGDRVTGLQLPERAARFFHNGQLRGEVADAEFVRLFFGIWLSPRTSEPALRTQLMGTAG